MELMKLTDRIYYLPSEEKNDRPVLGLIKGDRFTLAIDAGNSKDHVKKFYGELEETGLMLPDFTVITHWHWDHTFGMHAVMGKTIASRNTNVKLNEVMNWKWTDEAMKKRLESGTDINMCDTCIRVEYADRSEIKVTTADMVFTESMWLDLGGISCELIEGDSPHARDSVLVYVPEEKIIFVGDADCEDYYENHGKYDKIKLESYIKLLDSIDFETYVLGHAAPETKDKTMEYLKGELNKL